MKRPIPEPGSANREADEELRTLDDYIEKQDALIEKQEELITKQIKVIERLQTEIAELKSPVRIAVRSGGIMVGSKSWESVTLRRGLSHKPRPKLVSATDKS